MKYDKILIKTVLLQDMLDSEAIQEYRDESEDRLLSQYSSFAKRLGEADTDEERG